MKNYLSMGVLIIFILLGTMVPTVFAQEKPTPQPTIDPLVDIAEGNNAFGLELYHKLAKTVTNDKNLFMSPYSISTALVMTWVGARNDTESQMAQVLHIKGDRDTVGENFHQLQSSLELSAVKTDVRKEDAVNTNQQETSNSAPLFDLKIANSLWLQEGTEYLQPFLDVLGNDFKAPPRKVNFSNTEPVRLQINQWVEEKTEQKIKDLIAPGILNDQTKMVLVNAIYFKANWLYPFDINQTLGVTFHLGDGNTIQVPMMHQKKRLMIAENEKFQVLELPYKGNRLSMVVILPRDSKDLIGWEKNLNSDLLNKCLSQMEPGMVRVCFPKFKFSFGSVDLTSQLSGMGMSDAFGTKADFSGMTGSKDLLISHVLHKAFINVDEKGTEAAAATASVISVTSMKFGKIVYFNADHPFLFLIRDMETKSILFIGRVANPTLEE